MQTEDTIKETLRSVKYPGYSRDIVSFGLIKEIHCAQNAVSVLLELTSSNQDTADEIKQSCENVLKSLEGVQHVSVQVKQPAATAGASSPGQSSGGGPAKVTGVKHIVAVASGKGGVGKSTVSVNLACALQKLGEKVGLMDCDIYGPSIPLMLGSWEKPTLNDQERIVPPVAHGIRFMSMGLLVEGDSPVIWRGPMIMKTIQQFVMEVEWGELDYLLVDLPPGTGDAQLSLCQTVPLDGGVVVTTPQEASLGVVRKGIGMFRKVQVPVLGIVENMSYFSTPTGERLEIFGHGGGRSEAERQDISFLGEVPIYMEIREGGDKGIPVVVQAPESPAGQCFVALAQALRDRMVSA